MASAKYQQSLKQLPTGRKLSTISCNMLLIVSDAYWLLSSAGLYFKFSHPFMLQQMWVGILLLFNMTKNTFVCIQVFIVDVRSNKKQIKEAVRRLYDIQTQKINTLIRYLFTC